MQQGAGTQHGKSGVLEHIHALDIRIAEIAIEFSPNGGHCPHK